MVLDEYLGELAESGFRTSAVRLEHAPGKGSTDPVIPPAQMYVVDLHGPARATELLISG